MHKVSRSLLLAGVMAFGTLTAACGDKVNIVQPTSTAPTGITAITVTPSSATIGIGATNAITLAVAVVSDAATAKTVTWTTSSASVATVDATGKVTGVANGTVTITATATADPTKAAAAVITVAGGVVNTVNTVAISTVNQTAANGTVAPANLNNVAGQVDVTLFVSGPAGTVNLIQNCTAAGATSTTGDVIVAQQQVAGSQNQSPVTLSYNTAATGTVTSGVASVNNTSSTPIAVNGNCFLKASLGTAVATNIQAFTLNNVSFYRTVVTTSGPSTISAVNGLNYQSGDLTATLTPVNFAGGTLASISGTFAGRTFTNVTPAAGTQTFTITFPGSIVAQGTAVPGLSISNYTSPATGDSVRVASSVTVAGGNGFATPGIAFGPIRIDNSAPNSVAATVANPTGAQITNTTNFLNGPYSFAGGVTTPTDSLATSGTGTNTVTVTVGYALSTVASLAGNTNYGVAAGSGIGATQCSQTGFTIATTPAAASIPNSSAGVSTQYRARAFYTDKIGNVRCQDLVGAPGAANANGFFGVDMQAPLLTQAGGPTGGLTSNTPAQNAANGRIVTGTGASFTFTDSISGFVLNRQVQYSLYRNFTATLANCVPIIDGVNATQTGTTANGCTGTANSAQNVVIDGNTNVEGYYNLRARSVDQAGNFSAGTGDINAVYLLDNTAPLVQGISIPQNLVGATSTTFTSTATDNVDLASSNFNLTYSAATGGATLYYTGDNYGPNYDATRVTSATVNATVPFFIQQLQGTTGAGAPVAFTAADSGEAQQINVRAIDAANQTSVASVAAIPNINISSKAGFTTGTEFNSFQVTNAATALNNTAGASNGTRSATLSASAILLSGTAQTATVPFTQVCFFYQQTAAGFAADATIPNGALVQVGCVSAPAITDVAGVSRTWTYQLSPAFDPPVALGTAGAVPLFAVGVKANGVGILSQANNNVTVIP